MAASHSDPFEIHPTRLRPSDLALLVCPSCRGPLASPADASKGPLRCAKCGTAWPMEDGVVRLYREDEVRGNDRLLRMIYDALPAWHDPLTTILTPILQGVSERAGREHILRRIDIPSLASPAGRPLRILEVGIGGGANLSYLTPALAGRGAEIWGVELSLGMLRQCEKLVRKARLPNVRLLLADAHALPFPDHSFDRVFHVGGIGGYRDARTALAEMARVAVPGTPIVVVDEQLDEKRPQGLLHRLAFRAITFYAPDSRCPVDLLPAGATDILAEQPTRFYYCLRFRMPAPAVTSTFSQ